MKEMSTASAKRSFGKFSLNLLDSALFLSDSGNWEA